MTKITKTQTRGKYLTKIRRYEKSKKRKITSLFIRKQKFYIKSKRLWKI